MENKNLEQPVLVQNLQGEDVSQIEKEEAILHNNGSTQQNAFLQSEQLDQLASANCLNSIDEGDESKQSQITSKEVASSSANFGKFKDAQALLEAYNNLQSDYTKKCQALSQLQKANQEKPLPATRQAMPSASIFEDDPVAQKPVLTQEEKENVLEEFIFANPNLKDKFLARYFDEINLPKSPKLIGSDRGSSFVLTPQNKPKTLEEAGKLAREILNKKD